MKKRFFLASFCTLLIAAFAFSGLKVKATSLNQLRAKAQMVYPCAQSMGHTCTDPNTGGVIHNYEHTKPI